MTGAELDALEALAAKASDICFVHRAHGTTYLNVAGVAFSLRPADTEFIAALVNAFPALIAQAKAAEKWRVYAQHLSGCDALLYLPSSGRADMPCTCGFRALSAEEVSDAR
jgi:hypothetical protein